MQGFVGSMNERFSLHVNDSALRSRLFKVTGAYYVMKLHVGNNDMAPFY
jgi:hypothetical protein